ncbi:MAG TPA: hypothetical protein VFB89_00925 [Gemmatimonadales bacterium]|nr:hypothetical protein [Gemmatimonadales bacterium]
MRYLLFFAILVAAAPGLAAQDPRLEARLDPTTRAVVAALVDSARAEGLPTEPIVDKALEGTTKRASSDRIVAALRTLSTDLRLARGALGRTAPDGDVIAGASAIRAGASPETLERINGVRGKAGISVPLAVFADLVARGVPADTASTVILHLAEGGASDADYAGLERSVTRDIGAGAPPGASAAIRARVTTGDVGAATQGGPPPGVPVSPKDPKGKPSNRP